MPSDTLSRSRLARRAGITFEGARDLYKVCGYPQDLLPQDYIQSYNRGGIAGRIVDAFPAATWREQPTIQCDDKTFVAAVDDLDERIGLWRTLARADRLSGLGHYGVLLLGLDGGTPMDMPATGTGFKLMYLQPHGEATAEVSRWNGDPSSPRYGQPELYSVTSGVNWTGVGGGQRRFTAHHSRVIHFAENALEDAAIGVPRLERIWNRLLDLDKLLGGSAEIYWQNAAQLMAFLADAGAEWDPEANEAMREQIEEMQHGLRRFLQLQGVTPHSLGANMSADPGKFIEGQLDMIAGATGIPKRILLGSERGELSSAQDENNWAARIAERREQHATPNVVRPLFQKLITLGALPKPATDYWFEWPEADTLGEEGRARIADIRATALQKYLSAPGSGMVIPLPEFREMLGLEKVSPDAEVEPDPLPESEPQVVAQFARHKRR